MNSQERLHKEREQLLLMKQQILRERMSPTPPFEDLPYPGGVIPGREASIDPFVARSISRRVPATVNPGHSKLYQVPVQDQTIVVGVSPPPPQPNGLSSEPLNYSSVPEAALQPIFEYPPPGQRLSPSPDFLPARSVSPVEPSPRFDDISVIRVPTDDIPPADSGDPWHPTFGGNPEKSPSRIRTRGLTESKQPPSPRRIIGAGYNPSERSRSRTPERGRRVSQAAVEQAAEAIFNSGVEYRASPARLETGTRNNVNGNPIQPHELSAKKRALLKQRDTLEAELSGTEHNMGRLMVLRDQGGEQYSMKLSPGESIGIEFEETENNNGVTITRIALNSPAQKSNIQIGSIITGVNGTSTPNGKSLRNHLAAIRSQHPPHGDYTITLDIIPPAKAATPPAIKYPLKHQVKQRSVTPPRVISPRSKSPDRELTTIPINRDSDRDVLQLVVEKLDALENRTSHLAELVSRQQHHQLSHRQVSHHSKIAEPRFRVGTPVYCKTSPSSWKPGIIICVNWRGRTWPSDRPSVPYQIQLSGCDALVFAPYDDDRIVRIREPQSVIYEKVDYYSQRPSWEKHQREPTPQPSSSSPSDDNISSESTSSVSVTYKTAVPHRSRVSSAAAPPIKHPCAGPSGRSRSRPTVTGPRFTFTGKIPPRSVRVRDHPATPDC
eukprot:TRINITY_DN11016_c0_g1_i1.p1 TRINITY_DN11016_c0_g1~~TRINITY_DN11016_c0_g1_i1.p1  ORF type:complete len:665 (+),score=113.79 TRINITY_DN11016_c0_g1_i1:89-2083(+)